MFDLCTVARYLETNGFLLSSAIGLSNRRDGTVNTWWTMLTLRPYERDTVGRPGAKAPRQLQQSRAGVFTVLSRLPTAAPYWRLPRQTVLDTGKCPCEKPPVLCCAMYEVAHTLTFESSVRSLTLKPGAVSYTSPGFFVSEPMPHGSETHSAVSDTGQGAIQSSGANGYRGSACEDFAPPAKKARHVSCEKYRPCCVIRPS